MARCATSSPPGRGADEIKSFYLPALRAAGFDMRDIGYGGSLNAATAAYLGIANTLMGYRSDAGVTITVTTRSADGLILPSRVVQIHWQKWDGSRHPEWASAAPAR